MPETTSFNPIPHIATELGLDAAKVAATVELLGEGNTVPFIARYRKERTGSLDEVQIRAIEERRAYLVELEERRGAILASIAEQGKLTPELEGRIRACATKAALEDLYLPYKPKRRTRATIAREKGLEPLALRILAQPLDGAPEAEAAGFVSEEKGVENAAAALAGARDIAAEAIAERSDVRGMLRARFAARGVISARVAEGKEEAGAKFKDYFEHDEAAAAIPSHRYLAMRRGEREEVLRVSLRIDEAPALAEIARLSALNPASPFAGDLEAAIADGYKRLLAPSVESDVRVEMKLAADRAAVEVFAQNLRALLLAAPLGGKPVVGVDPGLRTGCKCAAVDETGAFLGTMTFNTVTGERAVEAGMAELVAFARRHRPWAIAIGNGTGGREAEKLVRAALKTAGLGEVVVVPVSEAGASVYSASELAGRELPELDLTIRGAVSIARRLQDPLAELVKIDPKAIGVGQYQHDVHQPLLAKKLDEVVESCVNGVGVELNTASPSLLSHVAGIGPRVADNIVAHRAASGPFSSRKALLDVKGVGPKAFEQSAGFLRIRGAAHPLDASAVHPERYGLVGRIAADLGVALGALIGNAEAIARIDVRKYVGEGVGEPTLRDIVEELEKPGLDPRREFEPPAFREDVQTINDLVVGMELEGVVTNVTKFGAFVDVGVHRDGLVHISQLADRYVADPGEVVKAGDRIKVRVLEVDVARERISFTAKSGKPAAPHAPSASRPQPGGGPQQGGKPQPRGNDGKKPGFSYNPFAQLLKK
jgi:protein Tex